MILGQTVLEIYEYLTLLRTTTTETTTQAYDNTASGVLLKNTSVAEVRENCHRNSDELLRCRSLTPFTQSVYDVNIR